MHKRSSIDAFEDELHDTGPSPVKKTNLEAMDEDDSENEAKIVSKRLEFGEEMGVEKENIDRDEEAGEEQVVKCELIPPLPPTYTPPRQKKKPKMGGHGNTSASSSESNVVATMVVPLEGDRLDK
jgi:hypothetical protein